MQDSINILYQLFLLEIKTTFKWEEWYYNENVTDFSIFNYSTGSNNGNDFNLIISDYTDPFLIMKTLLPSVCVCMYICFIRGIVLKVYTQVLLYSYTCGKTIMLEREEILETDKYWLIYPLSHVLTVLSSVYYKISWSLTFGLYVKWG
jgi:hypothetical protein